MFIIMHDNLPPLPEVQAVPYEVIDPWGAYSIVHPLRSLLSGTNLSYNHVCIAQGKISLSPTY
jgi:hypothetical protein